MRALQGVPRRHAYMHALVGLLSQEGRAEPFKILEVGSWAGGSAITWAKAIRKFVGDGRIVCIDCWRPYFDTSVNSGVVYLRMNEAAENGSIYGLFLHNLRATGVNDMVTPVMGHSHDVLPTLPKNEFSIVYLDGSHNFHDVQDDIRLSVDLVKEGGILCGDDLELQLSEAGAEEVARDAATGKDYVRSGVCGVYYHPGVTLAVSEAFGEVSDWEGFWAMRKTSDGWQRIDLSTTETEIPEHMSSAEPYSTESQVAEKPALRAIARLATRINETTSESDHSSKETPELIACYRGFNIVKFGERHYGVRQSLGEIDWSRPGEELASRHGEKNFFWCDDVKAAADGVDLDELQLYVDKLSAIVAETALRQVSIAALLGDRLGSLESKSQQRTGRCELGEYGGYRLIRLAHTHHVAVRADVNDGDAALTDTNASARLGDAVIVRESVDGLRSRIDNIDLAHGTARQLDGLRCQLAEVGAVLETARKESQETASEAIRELREALENSLSSDLSRIQADFQQMIDATKRELQNQIDENWTADLVKLREECREIVDQARACMQQQIESLDRFTSNATMELRRKIEFVKSDELAKFREESQQSIERVRRELQEQIADLKQNALVRVGSYIMKTRKSRETRF